MAARTPEQVAAKWARVTPQRTDDFLSGIRNPRRDWKTATAAADIRWKDGVTAAATAGRFRKQVDKTSSETWSSNAIAKGERRWPEGIAVGSSKYAANHAPYLAIATTIDPGPKYPKGDPRNFDRVRTVATALHKRKVG